MEELQEEKIVEIIRQQVKKDLDLDRELSDGEVLSTIREIICQKGKETSIGIERRKQIEKNVFYSLRKLDIIQEFLDDDNISEIMVNGPLNIFYEKNGRIQKSDKYFSEPGKLEDIIQRIVASQNKIVNESVPIVDTRLEDGSRVNIVLPPVAVDGGTISIRKFPKESIDMEKLLTLGTINEEISDFLKKAIVSRYNIFISGGTSSGKTTFLNALTEFIAPHERVITIEDSAELRVIGVQNLVRLEGRNKNLEGRLEITIRDLVRTSLRMRPDRIIVGECRGAETLEMLQAFNTGHDGGLSTGHGNSTEDMISRIISMSLMAENLPIEVIKNQIASGLDIMVHLEKMASGERRVTEIAEVRGIMNGDIQLGVLYELEGNKWVKKDILQNKGKAEIAGFNLE
ncbi:MAG: CpaF family protein [Lachnospiraceae bacterium]|nr:CpaF family protein [Lachnospiraceae bacterium]